MNTRTAAAIRLYVAIGSGAAIGALVRFLCSFLTVSVLGQSALFGTAFVNICGSFVIMFFATLTGPDGRYLVGPTARQFVMGGFCGGFTTFSSMSLETFMLLIDANAGLAIIYLSAVVGLSLGFAWLGYAVAARINRLSGDRNAAA
jgi:CrcB protein